MIDWRTIDYRDWELMIHMYRVLWSRESNLSVVRHHLETYQRQRSSIERSGQDSMINLHAQLMMWYVKCFSTDMTVSMAKNELIQEMRWYAQQDEHWSCILQKFVFFGDEQVCEQSLPQWYRFHRATWIWCWVIGAHLYIEWSKCLSLLKIHWYAYQAERVYIEDIADLWFAFEHEVKVLESSAKELCSRSLFWQWMFRRHVRQALERVTQIRQQVISQIKQKLCIEQQSSELGRLIHFRGFFKMITMLYSQEEMDQLQQDWRIYHPNYLVSYRKFSHQSLFKDEQKMWCVRHLYVWQQSLLSAQGNVYRYGQVIQWLFSEKVLQHNEVVAQCYHQTIQAYELFWHQLIYYCKGKKNQLYGLMTRLHRANTYSIDDIQHLWQFNKLGIQYSRLSHDGHAWLLRQYDQCVDPVFAMAITKRLSSTGHQIIMDMSYYSCKKAFVLWHSVAYLLNTPKHLQPEYDRDMTQILKLHQFLSQEDVPKIQAHMAALATYIWQSKWSEDVLLQVSSQMSSTGTAVWRRGMKQLNHEVRERLGGGYAAKQ